MSTPDHLKAELNATTYPSLAELRARILADETLPQTRRSDMASALASLAKALGRPAETIRAEPASLRPMLAGLTPAMVGLKAGRWRNVQSLTAAALAHAGIVLVQGRIRGQPSPAWLEILELTGAEAGPHFHLWRFGRYCSALSIEPDAITDAVLAKYQQDLETKSLVSDPARSAREAARAWNNAVDTIPTWPRQRLLVPDNRKGFALSLDAYPASLAQDIDKWCDWLGGAGHFLDRPFVALRPESVATRRRQIRAWLGALVQKGVKPEDLPDLKSSVTPEQAELGLRFFWERAEKRLTVHLHQMACLVVAIAKHWAKLPAADIERLKNMAKQARPAAAGMTSRNMARLRQLEDPDRLQALLTLPEALMEHARQIGSPSIHSARLAQTAAAFGLLLAVPMRLRNLRHVRIGVHLHRPPGQAMALSIPAGEVKNDVAIEAVLSKNLTKILVRYLDRYRPLLATDDGNWLFPGMNHKVPKSDDGVRTQIQKAAAVHCGLVLHPHLFRHIAAWITLRHNSAAHGQVQRILGHKSLQSTMDFYSGLESTMALRDYDALLDRERHAPETPLRPNGPRGKNR